MIKEQEVDLTEAEYRMLLEISRRTGLTVEEIASHVVKRELERRLKKPKKRIAKIFKIT